MKNSTLAYIAAILFIFTGMGSLVLLTFNIFLQAFGTIGSSVAFGILVYYIFTSIPTFQGAAAWVARGLSRWKAAEKEAVRLRIESSLNSAQSDINDEAADGLLPYPAKVEWVENVEKASFMDSLKEQVVVRMREHDDNPRNVAYAMIDYVSKGMIPYSRLYVDYPMMKAIDLTIIKKMLHERDQNALDYFLTDVVTVEVKEERVQRYMNVMSDLDKLGFLTKILLTELKELGLQLYPVPDQVAKKDTEQYTENLRVLAVRKPKQKLASGPYIGRRIRVGYVLIADTEKLHEQGSAPYVTWAMKCVDQGAKTLYMLSRGYNNKAAGRLAEKIANTCRMEIVSSSQFPQNVEGKTRKAQFIKLRVIKPDTKEKTEPVAAATQPPKDDGKTQTVSDHLVEKKDHGKVRATSLLQESK